MRVAILIMSLVAAFIMLIQVVFMGMVDEQAASRGFAILILYVIAGALVLSFANFSAFFFAIAAITGLFADSANYMDLPYWGGAAVILAVLSLITHRRGLDAKRKAQAMQKSEG